MIGNSAVVQRLMETVRQGRLHAFLLTGPRGVGKTHVAQELAAERLGRPVRSVEPEVIKVTPSESGTLSLDAIQTMLRLCKQTAAEPRTVIVAGADHLSEEAANALLVFLENPPMRTIVVLTAPTSESVLSTIRSRCVPFALGPVRVEELRQGLTAAMPSADPALIEEAIQLAAGLPGRAVRFVTDQRERVRLRTIARTVKQWAAANTLERMHLAAAVAQQPDQVQTFLEQLAVTGPVAHKPAVLVALRRLKRNVQPRAVLEAFAML